LVSFFVTLCLQKTPVSRFIIGYCGAVTSAVGIAVSRFTFDGTVFVKMQPIVTDILWSVCECCEKLFDGFMCESFLKQH